MRMLAAVLLILAPSIALAQPGKPSSDAHDMATSDCARARKLNKTCVLTIGPEEIEGGVVKPDGLDIASRQMTRFTSLVRVRQDFIPEILKSANSVD